MPNPILNRRLSSSNTVTYNANAQALFDFLGDVPDVVKPFYSDLIQSFEDNGVWSNANFWAILCVPTHNALNTLVEIKSLTVVSSFYDTGAISAPYNTARQAIPTFAGYSFRGNGYIRTGFIPSVKMTLNDSAEFLVTYSTEVAANSFNYGSLNTATQSTAFTTKSLTNTITGDAYSTTAGRVTVASADGAPVPYIKNRRSTTYMSIVKNGTVVGSIATSHGTLSTHETYLNTFNNNGVPSTRRNQSPIAAWGSFGSGLTSTQETNLNSALYTWQTSMERREGLETKQLIIDGNSHTVYQLTKMAWTVQMNLICQGWKFTNVGVSGQTLTQMLADFASEVVPLYNGSLNKNLILLYEGSNEMWVNGTTVDASIALVQDYIDAANTEGLKPLIKKNFCRIRPTSGAGLVTYPNETVWNLAVDEFNQKLDTDLTGDYTIIEASVNTFIPRSDYGSDGLYNTAVAALRTNLTYFVDEIHLTMLGYKEEADIDTQVIQAE